ncbi:hypothetical protein K458DRAFT_390032 [Lentithecium fluviatile CBS 122367]|uniref:Mid2 domain-containing protein n=1 Tax=Lentithecium fluviatile CBS 122367 TaxID=1168545 RepID=A0A6G1IZ88_9PLEO|nr:hypothetical protein K458DRAFT_390032 [Lentithecium fluviatile CBS 122367]
MAVSTVRHFRLHENFCLSVCDVILDNEYGGTLNGRLSIASGDASSSSSSSTTTSSPSLTSSASSAATLSSIASSIRSGHLTATNTPIPAPIPNHKLSPGAIAGMSITCILVGVTVIVAVFSWLCKERGASRQNEGYVKAKLPGDSPSAELEGDDLNAATEQTPRRPGKAQQDPKIPIAQLASNIFPVSDPPYVGLSS